MEAGAPTAILDHEAVLRMGATNRGEWNRRKEPGFLETLFYQSWTTCFWTSFLEENTFWWV